MIKQLLEIANELDRRGLYSEASFLDSLFDAEREAGLILNDPAPNLSDTSNPEPTEAPVVNRSTTTSKPFDANLKKDQEKLLEYGYFMDAGADGIYGPQTKAAIEEFQEQNELQITGRLSDEGRRLLHHGNPLRAAQRRNIVALGDSITAGGYARDLQAMIPGSRTFTLGYGGKQTGFIKNKLDLAFSKNPTDIIILAGVNDIASKRSVEHVTSNLREMYDRVRARGIRIVAVQLLPWHGRKSARDVKQNTFKVNDWIKSYINSLPPEEGHKVVVPTAMSHDDPSRYEIRREFSGDRVHPNKEGKKMLARIISEQGFGNSAEEETEEEQGF